MRKGFTVAALAVCLGAPAGASLGAPAQALASFSGFRYYLSQPGPVIRSFSCTPDPLIATVVLSNNGADEIVTVTVLGVSLPPVQVLDPVPVNTTQNVYLCSTPIGLVVAAANIAGDQLPWVWIDYNPDPTNILCVGSPCQVTLPFNPDNPNDVNGIGVAWRCPGAATYPTSSSGCTIYREIPTH